MSKQNHTEKQANKQTDNLRTVNRFWPKTVRPRAIVWNQQTTGVNIKIVLVFFVFVLSIHPHKSATGISNNE